MRDLLLDLVQVAGQSMGSSERVAALATCLRAEPGFVGVFTCPRSRGEVALHLEPASDLSFDADRLTQVLARELAPAAGERRSPGGPRQLTIDGAVIGGGPRLTAALLWDEPAPGAGGAPVLLGGLLLEAEARLLHEPQLYALLQVVQLALSRERVAARLADHRAALELVNALQPPRLDEGGAALDQALARLRRIVPFDVVALATATRNEGHRVRYLLPPACPEELTAQAREAMREALGLQEGARVEEVFEEEAVGGPAAPRSSRASQLILPALGREGKDCGRIGFFSSDAYFFDHHDVRLLGLVAPAIGAALEELDDVGALTARAQRLEDEKHQVEAQLGLARRLQAQLLAPCPPPPRGLGVGQCSETSQAVGGDFFAARAIGRHRYAVAVADVSGKGLPAGIVMAHTRGALWASWDTNPDPAAVMRRMNRVVLDSTDDYTFVTMAVLLVDVRKGEAEFCSAGHEPVLRAAAGADRIEEYATGDPPLGVIDGHEYRGGRIPFEPGDRLLVFTDGITEAHDAAGHHFGRARLDAALLAARGPAPDWIGELREVLARFAGDTPLRDDLTMIALTRPGQERDRV